MWSITIRVKCWFWETGIRVSVALALNRLNRWRLRFMIEGSYQLVVRARVVKKSVYAHWIALYVASGIPRASSASMDVL